MHLNPKGRDWGVIVNWDDLGKLYTGFIVGWSIILFTGIGWLLCNRRMPFIRMRNLPIAIASTLFLHVYLLKICMAYTTNGHFTCSAEFWIMSIYLPFGIALFQANVTQLRSISERQEKLLTRQLSFNRTLALPSSSQIRHLASRWRELSYAQKSYIFIACGMVVQFFITGILYGTTPTLQGDWSSYGKLPFNKGQGLCRKSLQWIPSAFWQLFWTWIYGPYELYKIRHIRDAHRWRLQTILCIVSGLPGSPLWLAALYSLAFKPVNRWWVPPMWLAPGIIVMQFCTIFFPIIEIFEHRHDIQKTLHSIGSDSTLFSTTSYTEYIEKDPNAVSTSKLFEELHASSIGRLYSLAALERALLINPSPLLHFAATKDFTAENIVFLTEIRCWREAWKAAPKDLNTGEITEDARTRLFQMAVEIFITSVYEKTAEFPINIEGHINKELTALFGPAVPEGQRSSGESGRVRPADAMFCIGPDGKHGIDLNRMAECSATLWADTKKTNVITIVGSPTSPTLPPSSPGLASASDFSSAGTTPDVNEEEQEFKFDAHPSVAPLGKGRARIREGFDEHVFDAAEASIKYLVLTNTWRKFVQLREKEQHAIAEV